MYIYINHDYKLCNLAICISNNYIIRMYIQVLYQKDVGFHFNRLPGS